MTPKCTNISLSLIMLFFCQALIARAPGIELIASTDAREVYVHAELILTIEIKTELSLRNGTLSKPQIKNAIVEPLAEDEQREEVHDGVKTMTYIRSYAIFPAEPGPLVIPSIAFEGSLTKGVHGWNDFFGRRHRVSASTKPIDIEVKPIPSAFPKDQPFLPVKSLTVIESFDDDDHRELSVNKALTRRFEIRALGSLSSFLPIIKAPSIAGVQSYSETGTKTQKVTPDGLLASANFSHVYLPVRPGTVTVPEYVISWWDTDLDQLKTTPIRSLSFEVRGEALKPFEATPSEPMPLEIRSANKSAVQAYVWPLVAGVFFLAWMITLVFALKKARKEEPVDPAPSNLAALVIAVVRSCEQQSGQNALRSVRALRVWAKEHGQPVALQAKLDSCTRLLEDALYSPNSAQLAGALCETARVVKELQAFKPKAQALPDLYPL